MRMGKVKYTRPCPICGEALVKGRWAAVQKMVGGDYQWVHPKCFSPYKLEQEIKRLDKELKEISGR